MKRTIITLFVLATLSINTIYSNNNAEKESDITLTTSTGELKGILREPTEETKTVVIIVTGAARTDRDGNQPQTKNNSLKMLAEALVKENIAVLNFDKRGVGTNLKVGSNESKLLLDTYVNDVKKWIELLKEEKSFENIIVIGHGEGSLISIMACQENTNVNKLISIAGTSLRASDWTRKQFDTQPTNVKSIVYKNLETLEKGERIENVAQEWSILFRSSLQPYLISLYKHTPTEEIAKIAIPTLIVQGDKDVQVSVEDAEALAAANEKAEKIILENMNYVLKECDKVGASNQTQYYLKPHFPLNKNLIPAITNFITEN